MTDSPVAFLGLGRLGLPVAANLIEAGLALRVWNRTSAKAEPLVAKGATLARRPADAVEPGGILVTLLWDDVSVEGVLRDHGLLERLGDGLHISMSTLSPNGSRKLARLHAEHGSSFVDAPIFGGRDAAAMRKLWVPISGPAAAKARARPLIEAMGAQGVYDFGEAVGAATAVKVAGNFLILSASASLREAFALAQAEGVSPAEMLAMMTTTLFPSSVYENHGRLALDNPNLLARSKVPGKDLALFADAAANADIPSPIARTLLALIESSSGS